MSERKVREAERIFWTGLLDPINWSPNISQISRETGISTSAIAERVKKLRDNNRLRVTIDEIPISQALREAENES